MTSSRILYRIERTTLLEVEKSVYDVIQGGEFVTLSGNQVAVHVFLSCTLLEFAQAGIQFRKGTADRKGRALNASLFHLAIHTFKSIYDVSSNVNHSHYMKLDYFCYLYQVHKDVEN